MLAPGIPISHVSKEPTKQITALLNYLLNCFVLYSTLFC